jgi:hypothetical protein
LPKIHIDGVAPKIVVGHNQTPIQKLSKYLSKLLSSLVRLSSHRVTKCIELVHAFGFVTGRTGGYDIFDVAPPLLTAVLILESLSFLSQHFREDILVLF